MLYHDKRFQLDESFPFVVFSQQQIKAGTSQSFLMADSNKFDAISSRFLSLDKKVLQNLTSRMAGGEHVRPQNEAEQLCFNLLGDLTYASSKTQGSISSKKVMQSEIWSLINHIGAPSWYITISPCDHKHPLCIYYADTNEKFDVPLRTLTECRSLVGGNPVANARFFDHLIQVFIKCVLGMDKSDGGLFGPISGYYCTVEQ
ncbi:hypothetical protein EV361DRAFT_813388, partial [Lentinula raphanica]